MMPTLSVRAGVSDGDGRTEVRDFELPEGVSRIRVESSAVCGTDVMLHERGLKQAAVLGHHTIGRIDFITPEDEAALGFSAGTRVVVEEYVACGECKECRADRYRLCPSVDLWTGGERVGMIPADRGTGLHGGNAEFMEIGHRHALHQLPEELSVDLAAWTLPLANAVDWTLHAGEVGPGKKVAVIGPGYHGLSCVAAAIAGGAESVIAVGRESATSTMRLGLARDMGAEPEISDGGLLERIRDRFGPLDTVIDTIGHPSTMELGTQLLGRFGVFVLAGLSGGGTTLDPTSIVRNMLTVRGVRGRSPRAVKEAISLLSSGKTMLDRVPSIHVPLEEVESTLRDMTAGQGPMTPHIIIDPWLSPGPSSLKENL